MLLGVHAHGHPRTHFDKTGRGFFGAGDAAKQDALAGPIRPDQPDPLPVPDLQMNPGQDQIFLKGLDQVHNL